MARYRAPSLSLSSAPVLLRAHKAACTAMKEWWSWASILLASDGVQDRGLSHTLRRKRVVVIWRLYWP